MTIPSPGTDPRLPLGPSGESRRGTGQPPPAPPAPPVDQTAQVFATVQAFNPWLPPALIAVYVEAWIDNADLAAVAETPGLQDTLALQAMRSDPLYATYFAGNLRDDGTVRYDERQYVQIMDAYRGELEDLGLNADLFQPQLVNLIEGDVSVQEFTDRVGAVTSRVLNAAPEVIDAYRAAGYADDLTTLDVIASVLDPTLQDDILNRRITTAEISAEAAQAGFGYLTDQARNLMLEGFTGANAQQLFSQAALQNPVLGRLAARHDDPDDPFTINDFLDAFAFNRPDAIRRVQGLIADEEALFTPDVSVTANRYGALSGLRPQ